MKLNLSGFIDSNKSVIQSHGLILPIYEAISNSIHAINERKLLESSHYTPRIDLQLIRDNIIEETIVVPDLKDIIIEDNGIGFHDKNLESFDTIHSNYKLKIGGKGFGRFSYLMVFQRAKIESFYSYKEQIQFRTIDFFPDDDGLKKSEPVLAGDKQDIGTKVTLKNFKKLQFKDSDFIHKKPQTISNHIIKHFALHFLRKKMPTLVIHDHALDEKIAVNDEWNEKVQKSVKQTSFKVDEHDFELHVLYMYDLSLKKHEIKLCAHDREVETEALNTFFKFIPKGRKLDPLSPEEDPWSISVYITSDYLDNNLNGTRDGFTFSSYGDDTIFADFVSAQNIYEKALDILDNLLKEDFNKIKENNLKSCLELINDNPYFYWLRLNTFKEALEQIPYSLPIEKKLSLFKEIDQPDKVKIQKVFGKLKKAPKRKRERERYLQLAKEAAEALADSNKRVLAEYVTQRKMLLEVLESNLGPFTYFGVNSTLRVIYRLWRSF